MPETCWSTARNSAPHRAKGTIPSRHLKEDFYVRNRFSIRFLFMAASGLFLLTATMLTLMAQRGGGNAPAAPSGNDGQRAGGGGRGRGAPNPLLSQPAPRLPAAP